MLLQAVFFRQPTHKVAGKLLGAYLCRKAGKRVVRCRITEVEVYDGPFDKASHASRGETQRNKIMFSPPGRWYIYFTYGMHWMLNIVTREEGYPAAILIRGIESAGERINGPARVTKFLKIDKRLNGKSATKRSGLWIEGGIRISQSVIRRSARVGVHYAGPIWSKRKLRFTTN